MEPSLPAPGKVMIDYFDIKPAVSFEGETYVHVKIFMLYQGCRLVQMRRRSCL